MPDLGATSVGRSVSEALVGRKAALRLAMHERRSAVPADVAAAASRAACDHLLELIHQRGARRVALYAAMRGELDPAGAAAVLRAEGATLIYPRLVGRAQPLAFHVAGDPAAFHPNRFGIPEPSPDVPVAAAADLDLIVVPGLAFDRRGGRLGWGGGYYDAVLTLAPAVTAVGFHFDFQRVDDVPRTLRDERVDFLVSERGAVPVDGGDG